MSLGGKKLKAGGLRRRWTIGYCVAKKVTQKKRKIRDKKKKAPITLHQKEKGKNFIHHPCINELNKKKCVTRKVCQRDNWLGG